MRSDLYAKFDSLEESHWWFVARRKILKVLLANIFPSKISSVLDVGSGPGINIPIIKEISDNVSCLEASAEAIEIIRKKYPRINITQGYFPETIPHGNFELITMFDVLEHIEDIDGALKTVKSLLKSDGYLVCTVPSFMFLWSEHDDYSHHKHRYTKKEITDVLKKSGFSIERATYFNTILFPAVALVRVLKRLFKIKTNKTDFDIGFQSMNSVLTKIFGSEAVILKYFNLPIGVSIFCVAKKIS